MQTTQEQEDLFITPKKRSISLLLGIGIVFCPHIFAWFTARNGYSTKARLIAFGWLAFLLFFSFRNIKQTHQAEPKTRCQIFAKWAGMATVYCPKEMVYTEIAAEIPVLKRKYIRSRPSVTFFIFDNESDTPKTEGEFQKLSGAELEAKLKADATINDSNGAKMMYCRSTISMVDCTHLLK